MEFTSDKIKIITVLGMALLAMVLIYAVTVNLPRIAAFVDKLLKSDKKPEDDGLYDIYSGRMPGADKENTNEKEENTNG